MTHWPLKKAYFWETAPFFRILPPLMAGIVCYNCFALHLSITIALILLAVAFGSYIVSALLKRNRIVTISHFILLHVMLVITGWSLSYFYDVRNDSGWFGWHMAKAARFQVRVSEIKEKEKTWKLRVQTLRVTDGHTTMTVMGEAFVYVYKNAAVAPYHAGDTLLIPSKWQPIRNSGNPYEFDYALYCAHNNIYYQEFLSGNEAMLYNAGCPRKMPVTDRVRNWCMAQLDLYLKDTMTKGLVQAMLLGDLSNLDDHLLQAYAQTGIVHIIAISGANVTLFFWVIGTLLFWLNDKKYIWMKYSLALPLVWFYVLLAGASPSAIRAAVAFSLLAIGIAFQKSKNNLNTLFATAATLLIAQPLWLFSLGFQLSFIAVLSLILFYAPVYKLAPQANKISNALWSTIAASIAAEILVAPLIVYYFHLFPLLFIFANVAAYIFMGAVLLLGIGIIAFSILPVIATVLGSITIQLVTWFNKIVFRLQQWNPNELRRLVLSGGELLLLYAVIACIALLALKQKRSALFGGLIAACLLICSFCSNEWHVLHQQKLVVYNIRKVNYAEIINGRQYTAICDDNVTEDKKDYVITPAHIGWHATDSAGNTNNEIFIIGGKKVLLLRSTIYMHSAFPVDYVVLLGAQQDNLYAVKMMFRPKKIIIASGYNDKQLALWQQQCNAQNILTHFTTYDGAWILE